MIRRNDGQVSDTDHDPRPDVIGSFESTPFGIHLRNSTQVSMTHATVATDSTGASTSYRVDMTVLKGNKRTPVLNVSAAGVANYYLGDVTAEQVPAFYRGTYTSVRDSLGLHIDGAANGPRLALVLRPGGNPNHAQWGVRFPYPGRWSLAAYDATGREIADWRTNGNGLTIDMANQATGIYVLRATEEGGASLVKKIVHP